MPKLCHKTIDKVGKICHLREVLTNPGKYAIYAMGHGAKWYYVEGYGGLGPLHVYFIMY
jgi:hypothetical protein